MLVDFLVQVDWVPFPCYQTGLDVLATKSTSAVKPQLPASMSGCDRTISYPLNTLIIDIGKKLKARGVRGRGPLDKMLFAVVSFD